MGRKRSSGNERLSEHVQRRSGGVLELRYPIPQDVAFAFPDGAGRPRKQIIRSLGTSDIKVANARADVLRTQLRSKIAGLRANQSTLSLDDYLGSLLDSEIDHFRAEHIAASRDYVSAPARRAQLDQLWAGKRQAHAKALLSDDREERRAVAGWAADSYFRALGRSPIDSDEFEGVVERCASTLVDSIIAVNDIADGKATFPIATAREALEQTAPGGSDRANLPISRYFQEVYLPALERAGTVRGENTISGKATAIRLF